MTSDDPNFKRRKYSSKGCIECKRKKLKCDETKPACLRCVKSNVTCSYHQVAKFSPTRTIVFHAEHVPTATPQLSTSPKFVVEDGRNEGYSTAYRDRIDAEAQKRRLNGQKKVEIFESNDLTEHQSDNMSIDHFADFDITEFDQTLLKDASLLAHDLNDLMSYDESDFWYDESPQNESFRAEIQKMLDDDQTDENQLEVEQLISFFDGTRYKNYLRLFYEKYSLWLLPLSNGSKSICNNTLLWHSIRCPFLLDAILSITARYEHFVHNSAEDENFRKYHLSKCLEGLSEVFKTNDSVVELVEPLILTVLILVADTSSIVNGEWRAHLQGAGLLFRKYVSTLKKKSAAILLSSMWFASFELLAITSNPLGGIIKSNEELEEFFMCVLDPDEIKSAEKYGLVMPDGYNVFLGYTAAGVELFTEFARISLRIRQTRSPATTEETMKMMHLIHLANKTYFATSTGIIEKDNPYHPKALCGYSLPSGCHSEVNNQEYCWFDISHKLHVLALYLKVLTDKQFLNTPRESPAVQKLVKEMLDACHFFDEIDFSRQNFDVEKEMNENMDPLWNDLRLFTVHSTLVLCGTCAINKVDRLKIEFYFKRLIRNGAKSLEQSLNYVESAWKGQSKILDYVAYV